MQPSTQAAAAAASLLQGLADWLPIKNVRTLVPQIRTVEGEQRTTSLLGCAWICARLCARFVPSSAHTVAGEQRAHHAARPRAEFTQ